jgi:putative oxidoreductase
MKLTGFAGVSGYIASKGVPLPEVAAAIAVFVELVLGIMLVVGFKTRWAALGMAVFTIVITPIFHAYWGVPAAQHVPQLLNFYKNFAIVGGLLMIVAYGAGGWSLDARTDGAGAGR